MFARLVRNERGAVMVEFTIVASLLLLLTFGVVEFGYLFWQFNSAEKATQLGVRKAVVTSPVATELVTKDCGSGSVSPGTLCSAAGATSFGTITCTGSAGGSCTGGYTFDATAFGNILSLMQAVFPLIQQQNVTVTYTFVGLGFAGRPGNVAGNFGPVPAVTVALQNMTFTFFGLQGISGFNTLTLPDFRATLSGEDLSSVAPS